MDLPEGEALLAHHRALRRLAGDLLRDNARAEDAVQDTWLSALRRPPGRRLEAWLRTVLRRRVSQLRASERRRSEVEAFAARRDETNEEAGLVLDAQREVVAALEALAEPYRTVIALRYLRELPPETIARRLGVPLETVRTRLRRGLGQLRERLAPRSGGHRALATAGLAALAGERTAPLWATGGLMTAKTWTAAAAVLAIGGLWVAYHGSPSGARPAASEPPESAAAVAATAPTEGARPAALERGPLDARERVVAAPPCAVSGVVVDPAARPVAGARVALFGRAADGAPSSVPRASAHCDEAGRFELAFDEPFAALLVALDEGDVTRFRPATVAVDLALGALETEPVVLGRGAAVEGLVQLHPRCPTPRSSVRLEVRRIDDAAYARSVPSLGLAWNGTEFERTSARGRCDDEGRFAIGGLERALHRLEVDPESFLIRPDPWWLSGTFSNHSRFEFTPPAAGVLVRSEYLLVEFEVLADGRPAPSVQILIDGGNAHVGGPTGASGRFAAVVDGDANLVVDFAHVDYETARRSFVPADLPPNHVERVDLEPATGRGSIAFEPVGDGAHLARTRAVSVTVLSRNLEEAELSSSVPQSHSFGEPRDRFHDSKGPTLPIERTEDGGIRLPLVPAGVYDLSISTQAGSAAPDEARFLLPFNVRVEVLGSSPTVVEWPLSLGSELRVLLGSAEAARWASARLETTSGERVALRNPRDGTGVLALEGPVAPGEYTLVVRSDGVDLARRPIELRAGEAREMTVDADG